MTVQEGILLLGYEVMMNVVNVIGLVIVCSLLKASVRKTGDIVHKVMIVSPSSAIRQRVCDGLKIDGG